MAKEAKGLTELFHDTLKDIYFAEKKILSALPKMAKAAQSRELRAAFEKHEQETKGQVSRLEHQAKTAGKNMRCHHGDHRGRPGDYERIQRLSGT
jgi:ferritin-like metal-binding protein YciE